MASDSFRNPSAENLQCFKDPDFYFGPGLPSSLEDLIVAFHRAHSNSLRLAHAISSGQSAAKSSFCNRRLAEYFQHVHVSHSDPMTLSDVRQSLGSWYTSNWWKGRFSFSCTAPEQIEECVAKGSADLVAMLMNAHHMEDIEAVVRNAANILTPNGTLAVVALSPAFRVVDNDEVNTAIERMIALWGERAAVENPDGLEKINSPLDHVSLPEGLFIQDVTKRIRIGSWGHGTETYTVPGGTRRMAEPRIHPAHRIYSYNHDDMEASGLRKEVDSRWIQGAIADMMGPGNCSNYENVLQDVELKIRACPAQKVTVEWAAAVLLATRK